MILWQLALSVLGRVTNGLHLRKGHGEALSSREDGLWDEQISDSSLQIVLNSGGVASQARMEETEGAVLPEHDS